MWNGTGKNLKSEGWNHTVDEREIEKKQRLGIQGSSFCAVKSQCNYAVGKLEADQRLDGPDFNINFILRKKSKFV